MPMAGASVAAKADQAMAPPNGETGVPPPMPSQVLIQGFANPADLAQHLLLLERSGRRWLIESGRLLEPSEDDAAAAKQKFDARTRRVVAADWREVRTIAMGDSHQIHIRELGPRTPTDLLGSAGSNPAWLNKPQRLFLEHYDNGDFAWLAAIDTEAKFDVALMQCGDSLVKFFIAELSDAEDCRDMGAAISRVDMVRRQVSQLFDHFESTPDIEERVWASHCARWDGDVYLCLGEEDRPARPNVYRVSFSDFGDIDPADEEHEGSIAAAAHSCFHKQFCSPFSNAPAASLYLTHGRQIAVHDSLSEEVSRACVCVGPIFHLDVPIQVLNAFEEACEAAASDRSSSQRGG